MTSIGNHSMVIIPGKTTVEEVIGKLCTDFNNKTIIFAGLLCCMVTAKDIMQAIQKRKIKKDPAWNLRHPMFNRVLHSLDEITGSLTFLFCAYLVLIGISSHYL